MKQILFALCFWVAGVSATSLEASEFFISEVMIEKIEREYGIFAKRRSVALLEMMNVARLLSEKEKLEKVNDFFNATPYFTDQEIWGVSDYWETRLEFIGKDKGDCEDFVIAKYFTLKELGVPTTKLYTTYVKSTKFQVAHMVLTYYEKPNAVPLVLDNYNYKILPASLREDLIPVYSFSGDDLFYAKQVQLGKMLPAATKQKRAWDELSIKLKD